MLLSLVPSTSYPIPIVLQSHEIRPPKLPTNQGAFRQQTKTPGVYLKTRRTLSNLGLALPDLLAADRALWWQFAVVEVQWDLEDEEVAVTLFDGTEERWELGLDSGVKSTEIVTNSLDDGALSEEAVEQAAARGKRKGRMKTGKDGPERRKRWAPSTVLAELHRLSVELRSAYEDLGMSDSSVDISSESDFEELMKLAADPKRKVPFEWSSAKTLYEYAMEGVDSSEEEAEAKRKGGPSQVGGAGGEEESADDPYQFSGQFKSRRRPRCLSEDSAPSDEPRTCSSSSSFPPRHDYLSLVHLLTRVREYLCDLFSATIIPHLRDILPPTYALGVVDSATVWTRRQAIEQSAQAAQLILELLDDEGDDSDAVDDQHEPDIAVFDSDSSSLDGGIAEYGGLVMHDSGSSFFLHGVGDEDDRYSPWLLEEKRQKRLSDNPLASLKDDFQLRCWCERALERRREIQRDEWGSTPKKPAWSREIPPWDVFASVAHGSDLDEPNDTRRRTKTHAIRSGTPFVPRTLLPTTLTSAAAPVPPPTSPPNGSDDDDDLIHSLSLLPPGLEASLEDDSSDGTDSDADGSLESDRSGGGGMRTYSRDFFYPEDLVGEAFLPKKLAREVVTARRERGSEMEAARKVLHAKLNVVAGLQKKMYELRDYVRDETGKWEEAREAERAEKETAPPPPSGLCNPGPSKASIPTATVSKTDLPLKAQPLRKQAADKALSASLKSALHQLEPSHQARQSTLQQLNVVKPRRPKSPQPRRRQHLNLTAFSDLKALAALPKSPISIEAGAPSKKRKRKSSTDADSPSAKLTAAANADAAEGADDEGPSKKRRRKNPRPMKRESTVFFVDPPAPLPSTSASTSASSSVPAFRPPSSSTSTPPTSSALADLGSRHLAALELSNRRRSGLEAVEPPSSLDWNDLSENSSEEEEVNVHVPWATGGGGMEPEGGKKLEDEVEAEEGGDEDEVELDAMLMEEEMLEEDEVDADEDIEALAGPVWGAFLARTLSGALPAQPTSASADPIARTSSPFPQAFVISSSTGTPPGRNANLSKTFPLSSERDAVESIPLRPFEQSSSSPIKHSSSTVAGTSPLPAPAPFRPFNQHPHLLHGASSSPSPAPGTPSSSQESLAQRVRDKFALASSSASPLPVRVRAGEVEDKSPLRSSRAEGEGAKNDKVQMSGPPFTVAP
ncbi:hypothetical protein JCM8547_009331 [Rhodosporidiobolus lusitaniae]